MKAKEIMRAVIGPEWVDNHSHWTVDCLKTGDPECEVTKIATCLTATPDVLRAAGEWGAELLITHEPTFYNHVDEYNEESPLSKKKMELIKSLGITIYRYHDSMHMAGVDLVNLDFIQRMGWEGDFDNDVYFVSNKPLEIRDIVDGIKANLGLKHPRIVGKTEGSVTKIKLNLGHRGGDSYRKFAEEEDFEVVIGGELCEWADGEPIRDAAQFGAQKTLLLLGHAGSEKSSMAALARDINNRFDGAEARYFECGELYTY
ncbi:MAG: Nif3-like dinuclear metal center hexameric protein [Clostridia bacterium]|nr:Nif3-like dinuclear metal center hexameric protein [Clostridia bacterium]